MIADHVLPVPLTIVDVRDYGKRIKVFDLAAQSGERLPAWQPGSHVDLSLPIGIRRSYSLVPSSSESVWRIGVLKEDDSRGASRWLHEQALVGDRVVAEDVRNNFDLHPAVDEVVFVAGGIGLTPFLSMLPAVDAARVPWQLHVAMAHTEELALLGDWGLRPEVHTYCDDRSQRMDIPRLTAALRPDQLLYVCGPARMLEAVRGLLPADPRVRFEAFGAEVSESETDTVIRIDCARSGVSVDVPAGRSVLAALRDIGVEVPSSCEEGVCGSCETAVLDGVPDHRDGILSSEEREAGETMMICVSRALTPYLTLDL
ncbi:PDR/VanB family oxidoreductase [Amycolatopsis sp. GM8]|uniref:PDR/VanB family oxidoreductase n=1 Tax=Amycolatopsis sp. GM8 TaxID=2896530 RepID=UPI001F243BE2|nr:PDR/VanB family oxidoreductase [Amycolatopsis sp. GM8]